jgi:hypothetical protein
MDKDGLLTGDAAYIFMKTKPVEELYDLTADPDEVHNLAALPEYQEKLLELRQALSQWQNDIGDKGLIPELDLIESMWPGKVQPSTLPITFNKNSEGLIVVETETPGASIAYQQGSKIGGSHWKLYSQPLSLAPGERIAARAVRPGFKTTPIAYYTNPTEPNSTSAAVISELFRVYPNPAREYVNLDFFMEVAGRASMSLYSTRGNSVMHSSTELPAGQVTWNQPLSETFNEGVYYLNLEKDGRLLNEKLIIEDR